MFEMIKVGFYNIYPFLIPSSSYSPGVTGQSKSGHVASSLQSHITMQTRILLRTDRVLMQFSLSSVFWDCGRRMGMMMKMMMKPIDTYLL